MALSIGGGKNKSKQQTSQSFNQTQTQGLTANSQALLQQRLNEIRGQQYQGFDPASIDQYLNPQNQAVIDATLDSIRAERGDIANQNRAAALGRSAKGLSDRRGVYEAQFDADTLRDLTLAESGLRRDAWDRAASIGQTEAANRNAFQATNNARLDALLAQLLERTVTSSGSSQGLQIARGSNMNASFGYGGG